MSGDAKGDTRTAQSSLRFEEIKYRESAEREQSERAEKSDPASQEQANGPYRELSHSARLEEKGQEFGAGVSRATEEAFGKAKDAPSDPLRRDAPPKEELEQPTRAGRPGGPQPAPGGALWLHGYYTARPSRGDGGPGGDGEHGGGGGKKLEFFEDKNPDRDPDRGGPG